MATSIRLIRRYVWLVDTIRRAGRISLEDINSKWAYNTSLNVDNEDEIPERTFHRHREAVADLFGIEIRCNRFDGNKYYIANEDALAKPSFTNSLFNALSIDNQLMADRDVARRIVFEDTPGGTEFLAPVIEALSRRKALRISYLRFNAAEPCRWIVEPALIRQSNRRWYLIGKIRGNDGITVFALDRLLELDITDQTYEPEPVDNVKRRFDQVIGVNTDEDYDCETVLLRVYGPQRAYIESLPIHHSQRIAGAGKDFTDYQFTLRPEYEFQRAILALGPTAQILAPAWLADEIRWQAQQTASRYTP